MRALILALGLCLLASCRSTGPPNFVVVYVDDVGYGDLGCYGGELATPHLDRLAAEGVRFTDFYSASAICTPSRAALLTGRYPIRSGLTRVLFPKHDQGLPPEERTLPELLGEAGYTSACIGKWHLGHHPEHLPRAHGFDRYWGVPYSNDMDKVEGKNRNLDRAWRERDHSPWNVPILENEEEVERPANQATLTARYTEQAIDFIEQAGEQPFFVYLAHTMPHIPIFVADELWEEDPERAYALVMQELDASVGALMEALEERGLADNTLVVFASDNGPWLQMGHHGGSAGPLRGGKFDTWEGGMRVPCLMRWPGRIPAGLVSDQVAATLDLLPTFTRLAGVELPADLELDGEDLGAVLEGGTRQRRPFHYYRGQELEAVRDGDWKLHLAKKGEPRRELYHLPSDIAEARDRSTAEPALVARLEEAGALAPTAPAPAP